jgi:hypothetical protein
MKLKSSHAFIALAVGITLTIVGSILLANVGGLEDRTLRTIAVVADGTLEFTTRSGQEFFVPLENDCKRIDLEAGRACVARFSPGDEVLIWYDSADPERIWYGSTPGGGTAILLLLMGVSLITLGLVALIFTSGFSEWLKRVTPLVDAGPRGGAAPRSGDDTPARGPDG